MKPSASSPPANHLTAHLHYQLVYTLTALLPPPIDDSPAALRTRNYAAFAKVAALLPVNANETDLAAQCIAARAQAEDILRLLRQHAGDIGLVIRLNAQYGSMVRTSLSVHARLMRVQAVRHKREAIDGAATTDAWAQLVAEQSMLLVVNPDPGPRKAASPGEAPTKGPEQAQTKGPEQAPTQSPGATRVEPPAACVGQRTDRQVPENETNSHDEGFETWLSEQLGGPRAPGETDLWEVMRKAMTQSRLAGRESPANGHGDPGRSDYGCHTDGGTAPT
jgi:hypothetical protein